MSTDPPTLGVRLRELRTQRGERLADVAARAGISLAYLSDIERGRVAEPSLGVLRRLSRALDVPLGDLLPEEEPELPEGLEAFLARPDITAEFAREARALGRTTDQVHQAWRSTLRRVEHEGRRPAPEEWDRVYLALRASIPPASGQGGGLESAHALAPGSPLVAEPAEDVLGALDQPERALLELRLGRAGEPPLSLAEAGQRLGLSAQDALSLEQQAMRRLGPGGWDEARRLLKERTRTA